MSGDNVCLQAGVESSMLRRARVVECRLRGAMVFLLELEDYEISFVRPLGTIHIRTCI